MGYAYSPSLGGGEDSTCGSGTWI